MARIQKTKNTAIPSWKVSWHDGRMSRSKAIQDEAAALTFKGLVEDAGEQMPALCDLDDNDLIQYGDWIHPQILIHLKDLLDVCKTDEEARRQMREVLHLLVDLPH
jgi:hypothetical protein